MSDSATVTGVARIADAFAAAREEGRAALMPYMMGAFPDRDGAERIAAAYANAGADLIELGIPFSDPLADGPVIHAAATAALEAGATLDSALEACAAVSDRVPVVVMAYSNMILAAEGAVAFASRIARAGASGAIVPDLPLEEASPVREALAGEGLALVPLVAPTTPPERRRAIGESAEGFVYLVSTVGVTGERDRLPPDLIELIDATRADADVPVAVGFGIGTAEQAAAIGAHADGIIIGSRLVRLVQEAGSIGDTTEAIGTFLREVRAALVG